MSILDGFPCSATAICAEDSEIVMITRNKFEQLCRNKPDIALKLLKDISKLMSLRFRQMTGMLIDFL